MTSDEQVSFIGAFELISILSCGSAFPVHKCAQLQNSTGKEESSSIASVPRCVLLKVVGLLGGARDAQSLPRFLSQGKC